MRYGHLMGNVHYTCLYVYVEFMYTYSEYICQHKTQT